MCTSISSTHPGKPELISTGFPAREVSGFFTPPTNPTWPATLGLTPARRSKACDEAVLDAIYLRVVMAFGEENVVELSTRINYFALVCWVMNVARTPSRPTANVLPLVSIDVGLSSPA